MELHVVVLQSLDDQLDQIEPELRVLVVELQHLVVIDDSDLGFALADRRVHPLPGGREDADLSEHAPGADRDSDVDQLDRPARRQVQLPARSPLRKRTSPFIQVRRRMNGINHSIERSPSEALRTFRISACIWNSRMQFSGRRVAARAHEAARRKALPRARARRWDEAADPPLDVVA
jgi:hypothetical protein